MTTRVVAADDQQSGRAHAARRAPARSGRPPRETTALTGRGVGGGPQRRAGAGAGAEIADAEAPRRAVSRTQSRRPRARRRRAVRCRRRSRRWRSSSGVSRSISSVARPAAVQRRRRPGGCAGCGGCCRCRARRAPARSRLGDDEVADDMLAAAHRDLAFVVARGIGRCGRGRAFGDSRLLGARRAARRPPRRRSGRTRRTSSRSPIRSGTSSEMTRRTRTRAPRPTRARRRERRAPAVRTALAQARAAARALPPVARPSSTTITVLPDTSTAGRSPR